MFINPQEELQRLDKRLKMISVIDAPGAILVGLGLYGKFNKEGKAFHPLLDDSAITTGMLIVGGMIMAWGGLQILSIARRRQQIMQRLRD